MKYIIVTIKYFFFLFLLSNSYAFAEKSNSRLLVEHEVFALSHQQALTLSQANILSSATLPWKKLNGQTFNIHEGKNWFKLSLHHQHQNTLNGVVLLEGKQRLFNEQFFITTVQSTIPVYEKLQEIRNIENQIFTNIVLQPSQNTDVIIYIESSSYQDIVISYHNSADFIEHTLVGNLFFGIVLGGILALSLCALVIFIAKKSLTLFLLSGTLFFQALILLVLNGITVSSFIPHALEMQSVELPLLIALFSIFILWFCSEFFKLAFLQTRLYLTYHIVGWGLLGFIGLSLFLSPSVNMILGHLIFFLVACLLFCLTFYLFKAKEKLASVFLCAVLALSIAIIVNVNFFGFFTFNLWLFSATFILIDLIFVFMLSSQVSVQIAEIYIAQREALESEMQSRQAQEELLILQNENQEQLESRVQERTLELNIALQELEEANRELEQKNTFDDLTGLYNRRFYDQKLLAEFRRSRRNLTPLSLVVIDIDHFKLVNDNYGHSAGDKCLVTLGLLIKQILRRSSDIGCRYGGEEFCLILPETDSEGAVAFAQELRELVMNKPFELDTTAIDLTISCGVSTYQQQKDILPVDIFNEADKALYKAKLNGRNQVQVAKY